LGKEESIMMVYRCGWCGTPCDKDGEPIETTAGGFGDEYKAATPVHGHCCSVDKNEEFAANIISYEMAMDACSPEMEGQLYR